ncbi:MAG: HPP family protein, partial [Aestuariivirgaceae bacterium]|nr:HPP family protein [Aestuariivirgaceae bacterium]
MDAAAKAATPATPATSYAERRMAQTVIIALGVALIAGLADFFDKSTGIIIFAPPLAASLVLIIALPDSAMSQPRAVIGGQLLGTLIS